MGIYSNISERVLMKIALIVLICLTLLTAGTLAFAATSIPLQEHLRTIEAWKGQLELLKWIGGVMVTGLVTAVGVLWAALNTQRKEQNSLSAEVRSQLLTASNEQTKSNAKLAATFDTLRQYCSERNK
jgi:hypothetical protein